MQDAPEVYVTDTQQWDWAVVSCQTRIFTRFFNGYITLAFLQIFGMKCVAMILEKNLDSPSHYGIESKLSLAYVVYITR